MGTKVVAKLGADLTANTSNFDSKLNSAKNTLGKFKSALLGDLGDIDKAFEDLGGGIGGVKTLVGSLGVAAAGVGLVALAKSSLETASAINDTADRLGLGTEALQKYQYAAKQVGVDNEQLENAFAKLNGKIADGSFKYKSTEEGLLSIAEAVKNAKTELERAAIVNDAFGEKLGAKMIPFLINGAAGLKQMGDEAARVGAVMSDKTIRAADNFGDAVDTIGSAFEKSFKEGYLTQFVEKSGEMKATFTDPAFVGGIKAVGTEVGALTSNIIEATAQLGRFLGKALQVRGSRSVTPPPDANEQTPFGDQQSVNKGGVNFVLAPDIAPPVVGGGGIPVYKPSTDTKAAEEALKRQNQEIKDIIASLQKEDDVLDATTGAYGKSAGAIARAAKSAEIYAEIQKDGIKLTAQQKNQIEASLDVYQKLIDKQDAQKKVTEAQKKAEEERAQAFHELGDEFAQAFEDGITGGKKFKDVINSLLQDILKLALKTQLLQPIMTAVFGDGTKANTGIFSGGNFLSAIFSPLGSFGSHATGTDYVTRDTTARLHRGEAVIDAQELRGLRRGGDAPIVNVYDRNNSDVSARNGADGRSLEVMIDQVTAKNMLRRGSKTSGSLNTVRSRTLIRRG